MSYVVSEYSQGQIASATFENLTKKIPKSKITVASVDGIVSGHSSAVFIPICMKFKMVMSFGLRKTPTKGIYKILKFTIEAGVLLSNTHM